MIEASGDFRRPMHATGTVVRIEGSSIVVKRSGVRGGTLIEHYGCRDAVRSGGLGRAELVNADVVDSTPTPQGRQLLLIDAAYREWARKRSDVDRLRRLQAAKVERLQGLADSVRR